MSKISYIFIISALVSLAIGCGGNQAACEDYVDSYNELECVSQKLSIEEECPDELDDNECDMEDYYACLTDEATCSDGKLINNTAKCSKDCEEE